MGQSMIVADWDSRCACASGEMEACAELWGDAMGKGAMNGLGQHEVQSVVMIKLPHLDDSAESIVRKKDRRVVIGHVFFFC